MPAESTWRREFEGFQAPTPLWLDRLPSHGVVSSAERRLADRSFSSSAINELANRSGLELATVVGAAWGFLLHLLTGEKDVVFGQAISSERVVPIRMRMAPDATLLRSMRDVQAQVDTFRKTTDVSLEHVREWTGLCDGQSLFESAIAQTALVSSGSEPGPLCLPLLVSFDASPTAATVHLNAEAGRFDDWTISRTLDHLITVFTAMVDAPGQRLEDLSLLDDRERQLVMLEWNQTAVDHGTEGCIHEVFARQAERFPDSVAVVAGHSTLTYKELDVQSNQLAHYLRLRGVSADIRVGVCLERTPEMIVALLGILKAGGGYLPLDAHLPKDRLAFMLDDADVPLVITQESLRGTLPFEDSMVLVLDREHAAIQSQSETRPRTDVRPDQLAYVNYTSGSTGTPKGVEILHRSVNRLVCAVDYVALTPDQKVLHAAPLSFDASTFEIWGPLLNGGRLVLYPDEILTAEGLARTIKGHGVTTLWLTAALFNAMVDQDARCLLGIEQLLVGGEALSVRHVRKAMDLLPDVQLINGYGPTESTTFTACYRIPRSLAPAARTIPIGRPIRDTRAYVLDDRRRPVAVGIVGELYIGGSGLARGYLNRPELTAEKFIEYPVGRDGERLYRSGDLVRYLPDGTLDFVGRVDHMVKVRGFRIELGEIEAALASHSQIGRALVVAREDASEGKRLIAYVVAREGVRPTTTALRRYLEDRLPAYMIPSAFVWLPELPISSNGKVDHRALPAPDRRRPDLSTPLMPPRSQIEKLLCALFGEMLSIDEVGATDGFFDLGGNSLVCLNLLARLRAEHGHHIPVVEFFRGPTPERLAEYLALGSGPSLADKGAVVGRPAHLKPAEASTDGGVAVIGMAGRFPGADSVEEMWRNICAGVDSVTHWSDAELDESVPSDLRAHPQYVRARGVLRDVEMFDAEFFGINGREAEVMDPQQRIFLEVAWQALENAGYVPEKYRGLIGAFAGMYDSSYFTHHISHRADVVERVGAFQAMVAHEKDYLTTRVAHRLGLTGPTLNIQTACSTSLVAISEAFFSLRAGRCDMALAGGVAVTCPPRSGYLYQEGAMLSPDGHTRPFDRQARGTVFSDGVAIVVLKRLKDALADRDTIYAVLRGAAVNNDGANRSSFSAPSVDGQASVIAMAHACAGVDPRTIAYVEAHGTATPLGDPIEVEALTRAFRLGTPDTGFCGLGSVKSNFGHLVIAAGATGLVKTVLALSREQIPPTIHFQAPNSRIDFASSPFYVNATLKEWRRGETPRRAGVSSFGVGGTNAHVVVEEAPDAQADGASRPAELLVVSARSAAALETATTQLISHLRVNVDVKLGDVASTLQSGRREFQHRRVIVAADATFAADMLEARDSRHVITSHLQSRAPRLAFMFPGQGSQYPDMGLNLYREDRTFRSEIDRCAEILRSDLDFDLLGTLYTRADNSSPDAPNATAFVQPAVFATEYALARTLMHCGVEPHALIGHSVGEFVCATLAGVLSLSDALRLVAVRGRLMQELPAGAMLSVRLAPDVLAARLGAELAIASVNSPSLSVASGPEDRIAALQQQLDSEGVLCKRLRTSHAFHSPMMDPVVEPFAELVSQANLQSPRIPILSTVTGRWLTAEEATDPMYWARHLRATVRFSDGVKELCKDADVLLEVGPGSTLATLSRQQATDKQSHFTSIATLAGGADAEWQSLLKAIGQLWLAGAPVDWHHHHGERRRRVPLPTYPFERKRYWIDACDAKPSPKPHKEPVMAQSERTAKVAGAASAHELETARPLASTGSASRKSRLIRSVQELLETTVGIELTDSDASLNFVELGLDSLTLTQTARLLHKAFGIDVTFRQLMEDYPTLESLAEFMDRQLPPETPDQTMTVAQSPLDAALGDADSAPGAMAIQGALSIPPIAPAVTAPGSVQNVIDQQLRLMAQQLALLSTLPAAPERVSTGARMEQVATPSVQPAPPRTREAPAEDVSIAPIKYDVKKAFGAIARIHLAAGDELTPKQRARLHAFTRRYTARTKESKRSTEANRPHLADPRVVSGFRPAIKELVYPIVIDRSKGSKLWDLDGNEYVDVLCGFGAGFFGWQPDFVNNAVKAQIDRGIEIGPQHPLAGDVARSICELTEFDRAGFCNTGSEAVMGAMRIARTVTGRDTIAIFSGSYHGIFDEVIVRGTKKLRAVPAAPGIMPASCQNVLVLDYGTPESLDILRARAGELAAIMVEPVQSRRPDFQPRDFLLELRKLTSQSGALYIFDEMITGFRVHPRGAQGYFGIQADLATYGKLIGGGYPIGIIAGKREYMDALDGGSWQFGDDSMPTVGVTYFAGTFVRHPLALAAAKAVVDHLKQRGPELQQEMNARTLQMASELNSHFTRVDAPLEIRTFGSLWKAFYTEEQPFGDLLFAHLRDRGLHILDGFPCFLTTAHSDADIAFIVRAFKEAVAEMQESGFLPEGSTRTTSAAVDSTAPPVPGARIGRDPDGTPAWYVPHAEQPGQYVKLAHSSN